MLHAALAQAVFDGAWRRALLQRMSPEHKFSTAARLSGEVLGGVADESLSLAGAGEVLADALRILASKHIRVRDADGVIPHAATPAASQWRSSMALLLHGAKPHLCCKQCLLS